MNNIKKLLIGTAFSLIMILSSATYLDASCLTSCTTDEGLSVRIMQSADGWEMNIFDDGELVNSYNGDGQYNGTICFGNSPGTVSEA
jgi:hypothetical protein